MTVQLIQTKISLSDIKIWISDPKNTNKKIVICIGSVWLLTDLIISILQRVTDTDEKNILGPFTYLSDKLSNKNQIQKPNGLNNSTIIFGIPSNLQFSSSKGLAKNMLGGYTIGIAFGMSSLSIINSVIHPLTNAKFSNNYKESILLLLSNIKSNMSPFSLFIFNSCIFYTMEYIWAALFHPKDVSFSSFMLYDHSNEFHIALVISIVEYWIQYILFNDIKKLNKIHFIGLSMVILGQIIRTIAQFTAGINFTHQIAYYKKKDHTLIKHGIYTFLRHPSYFGFFYWSIGTQLLLCNPVSTVLYTYASWKFFADRIPHEEEQLINFFGDEYKQYRKRTIIGIPFV
eukprot:316873_1